MLLVTGATGYLGSALVAELGRRGMAVRAVVRDPRRAAVLPDSVETVAADLDDMASVRAAVDGCDGVFHVAGVVRHSAEEMRRANVDATARVLRAAMDAGVRRVVFTSTTAAIIDAGGVAGERAPNATALTDPYVIAKMQSEGLMLAAATAGYDAVIVNPVSIYGPSPRGPESYNTLLDAAARGQVREIVDAEIGWILAQDAAAGHVLAFERGASGHRYILNGQVAPFSRVLNTYAELVGSHHRVTALPPGSVLAGDVPLLARRSQLFGMLGPARVDDAQARALGFSARGVGEGLRLTAAWMTGG